MIKKMIRSLTNNIGLKLLSVFFALILWLVVMNIDDPQRTTKFTIPITIENENYLTELGKYYRVEDNVSTTTISVTGKRNTVEKLNASDFKAVANLENIEDSSQVKIEVTPLRFTSQLSVTQKNEYLHIKVGELAVKRFVVATKITGTPAENAAVGTVSLNRNLLKLSGPEEIVNRIDSAAVTINVDGFATDITDEMIPELYDADGKRVDTTELTLNMQTVQVNVSMLEVKAVPLSFHTTGELGAGYQYVKTNYSPESVKVKGNAALLNTINEITIPAEVLDLTNATKNIKKTVDITSYLPTGIELVNTKDAKVEVTVVIDENETRVFDVPTANLTIKNLSDQYELTFAAETVKLTLSGFASELDRVDPNAITGSIDLSGAVAGTNSVPITIDAGADYTMEPAMVVVYLNEKEPQNMENSQPQDLKPQENSTSDGKEESRPSGEESTKTQKSGSDDAGSVAKPSAKAQAESKDKKEKQ